MSDEKWLLIKRDLYERPDHHGYTGIREEAGRYSKEVAEQHMDHYGPNSAVREKDAPEFCAAAYDDLVITHLTKQRDRARAEAHRAGMLAGLKEAEGLCEERPGGLAISTTIRARIAKIEGEGK